MAQFTIIEIDRIDSISNTHPQISGENVVWVGLDSNGVRQLFLYNGKDTIQLSQKDNNEKIDGNRVVWQRINLADSTISVMMATLNDTKSSSIPTVDRPTQIINASAIAIFSLTFIYLLKKLIANSLCVAVSFRG